MLANDIGRDTRCDAAYLNWAQADAYPPPLLVRSPGTQRQLVDRQPDGGIAERLGGSPFGARDILPLLSTNGPTEARFGRRGCILAVTAMISRRGVLIALGWTPRPPKAWARDNGQFSELFL